MEVPDTDLAPDKLLHETWLFRFAYGECRRQLHRPLAGTEFSAYFLPFSFTLHIRLFIGFCLRENKDEISVLQPVMNRPVKFLVSGNTQKKQPFKDCFCK